MRSDALKDLGSLQGHPVCMYSAAQVRERWVWCCLQVIYGLRNFCPVSWPEGEEPRSTPDPVGKCDSAVLLLQLLGVWLVTGAA